MADLPENFQTAPLSEVDPEIATVLDRELHRQQRTLEMIASENFVPQAVLDAAGSVLTNKYAEGYPGRRYYGGCEEVDVAEQLAIDRAKALFGADHANVQPHAGAQANNAVYFGLLQPGDTILGLALDHGGHLSHGMKINVSGKFYNPVAYHVRREDYLVDMDEVASLAAEHKPKMIVAGWSAYPRQLDFPRFREIADSVGALLMVDMAHFAGLVAANEHPSPVPYADVVTTTVHKTLAGPRSGLILCKEEHAKAIDKATLHTGWTDVYARTLPGQYFVLDDSTQPTPPGEYVIRVTGNPPYLPDSTDACPVRDEQNFCRVLRESNYSDNVATAAHHASLMHHG